jgi:hypothetical protein
MDVSADWKLCRSRATYVARFIAKEQTMKALLLAGIMSAAFATASYAQYWVAGDRTTGKCNIETSQPVVFGLPGYAGGGSEYKTSFASGPYKSLDDAKLARSGISACPPEPEPAADDKKD